MNKKTKRIPGHKITGFIPFDNGMGDVIAPGAFNPKDLEGLPVRKLMDHNVIHDLGTVTEVSVLANGGVGFTWQANESESSQVVEEGCVLHVESPPVPIWVYVVTAIWAAFIGALIAYLISLAL